MTLPEHPTLDCTSSKGRWDRRKFLIGLSGAFGASFAAKLAWERSDKFHRASVGIFTASHYDGELVDILLRGLKEMGVHRDTVRGKSILLKPNLVEPELGSAPANTHPMFVRAVAEVFRHLGARDVLVGEGQAHYRDSSLFLHESALSDVLERDKIPLIDLNYDDVLSVPNRLQFTSLPTFFLPKTLRQVDWIVSLPKMKTHHWAGVSLSMKNLFGVLPGICYGWPKNLLHWAGISQSILDLTHEVCADMAIVDGIVGMEGDGPINGRPKAANVIVMGRNLPAVDATATRVMGLDPWKVPYLAGASGLLGPIATRNIEQRGECIETVARQFELLDHPVVKQFWD
jgi:uncharacterized protein (DUF362 family)